MQENEKIIALLIDAENVSQKYIQCIISEVSLYGTPAYKRIYGDWTLPDMSGWKKMLLDNNLSPIQQFRYTQGKNATDSAMIIDAMDILYSGHVDGFCLVSSDSDFTRLAARLRESRMTVIGMGEQKTPGAFKAACDTFKYLEVLYESQQPKTAPKKESRPAKKFAAKTDVKPAAHPEAAKPAPHPAPVTFDLKELTRSIREILEVESDEEGYMLLSQIGVILSRKYPDFDTRNYGFSKMYKLIEATGAFDTKAVTSPGGGKIWAVRAK
ncbi:MAG: NYN domain-containing protein [Oscillospiraceae bacterium]|nr:NYN domain-containing protein [Oscillospiraceae bacterium]